MHKYLTLTALAAMLVIAPVAFAEDGSNHPLRPLYPLPQIIKHEASTTRADIKDLRQDRHDASTTPEDMHQDRKDIRMDVRAGVALRVHNEVLRFGTLLEATIHRLQTLITRMTTRAGELDAKGISTADGRGHLAQATTELTAAQADLDQIKADADANATLDASSTPQILKDKYQHARDLMKDARDHIQKAYGYIKEALKSFRAAAGAHGEQDGDQGEHATSTESH
jgi:exonuclease VII small subunit